jgi:hypothetical protein
MRFLYPLALLLTFALSGPALAQDNLADGDPPLTAKMATDYIHFMQWTTGVPLTLAQEAMIQKYLVDSWKANDAGEIKRTLNLLALRGYLLSMHSDTEPWAAMSLRRNAVLNWRKSPTLDMPTWGLAIYNAAHLPLVKDTPPLTKQMESAYEEMGYFMMSQVYGTAPSPIDAVERNTLADALASDYAKMTPDQKANFALLPQTWVQLRTGWPSLDEAHKAALVKDWKANFEPKQAVPAKPKKGAKPAPPPSQPAQTPLMRLMDMTWVTNPAIFAELNTVGQPYGLGWGP